jgi:hypothetical protein
MLPEETDAFDSLFLPDGVTVPEPAEEREPALGGWGNDAMLTVRRKVLSGELSFDRSADEDDLKVGMFGLEEVCWGVGRVEGRGDDEGVRSFRESWVGGAILLIAGDCVRVRRLFLDFGVGIGGRADWGGVRDGRDGCGSVVVMMLERPGLIQGYWYLYRSPGKGMEQVAESAL